MALRGLRSELTAWDDARNGGGQSRNGVQWFPDLNRRSHCMPPRDFDIGGIDAPETSEHRVIRAMLRPSDEWMVLGRTVQSLPGEYSDECPDVRGVVDHDDLADVGKSMGMSRNHISAVRWRRNLCQCCGHRCQTVSCVERRLRHIDVWAASVSRSSTYRSSCAITAEGPRGRTSRPPSRRSRTPASSPRGPCRC